MQLTIELGIPLAEAKGEIAYSAAFVRFFAEEAEPGPRRRPGRGRCPAPGPARSRRR